MQASTLLAPKDARRIALRQGLLFGTFAGCLALLGTEFSRFIPGRVFSLNFIYILAFIAFFIAGWRAAKRTSRIDMGALAGFWAGVAVAILGQITLFVYFFTLYEGREIGLSSIVAYTFSTIPTALLALLFGPATGALGGFIGKTYAENSAPQPAAPQAPASMPQPPGSALPNQPSPPQQNQP